MNSENVETFEEIKNDYFSQNMKSKNNNNMLFSFIKQHMFSKNFQNVNDTYKQLFALAVIYPDNKICSKY